VTDRPPRSEPPPNERGRIKSLRGLAFLSAALLGLWAAWALVLRALLPRLTPEAQWVLGLCAQLALWGGPCAWYLTKTWGTRWREPLGIGFPLGAPQVFRTVSLTCVVALFFFVGTAAQLGVPVSELWARLVSHGGGGLSAPFVEELVFRGVILAELLNWVHSHDKSNLGALRLRFWGAQAGVAMLFVLVHWPGWLVHHGWNETWSMSAPLFALSVILGFVFANTRSIWGCILLHWLNNQLSGLT